MILKSADRSGDSQFLQPMGKPAFRMIHTIPVAAVSLMSFPAPWVAILETSRPRWKAPLILDEPGNMSLNSMCGR